MSYTYTNENPYCEACTAEPYTNQHLGYFILQWQAVYVFWALQIRMLRAAYLYLGLANTLQSLTNFRNSSRQKDGRALSPRQTIHTHSGTAQTD